MSKYSLTEVKKDRYDQFFVKIKADSNDADYITTEDWFSKVEFDSHVIDELIDLKSNYSSNHKLKDFSGEWLSIPYNGWDGHCHSLESIDIQYVDPVGKTWDVELT